MKRTPLVRKTQLAKRTKRMAAVSATSKRGRETRQYSKMRVDFLTDHPVCEYHGCTRQSTDVHHKAGRRGGAMLDQSVWMACCRQHHRIIHDDPKAAEAQGYLIRGYKQPEDWTLE